MLIPKYFYTPQDLDLNACPGTIETKYLDFKQTLNNWDIPPNVQNRVRLVRVAQKELCRDIAQFANTEGGSLVIGVREQTNLSSGLKVAGAIVGVISPDDMRQWIANAVQNFLVPRTFTHSIEIIRHADGTVLVVNIHPSRNMVALWDAQEQTIEYLYRTSHGKAYMNPDEAEVQIMNSSRFGRIVLARAIDKYIKLPQSRGTGIVINLAGGIWDRSAVLRKWPTANILLNTLFNDDDDTFELHVTGISVNPGRVQIPFTAIKDAWVGSNNQGATVIGLLLTVRIVTQQNSMEYSIESYADN